ncbi:MAG TPA: hypothetical protein VIG24_09145 [Acidimicrobiia bacterium]
MNFSKWWPTSKMTAVGISGVMYTWGVFALEFFYDVSLAPVEVAANQTWVMFLIGYAVTEHRRSAWISQQPYSDS